MDAGDTLLVGDTDELVETCQDFAARLPGAGGVALEQAVVAAGPCLGLFEPGEDQWLPCPADALQKYLVPDDAASAASNCSSYVVISSAVR